MSTTTVTLERARGPIFPTAEDADYWQEPSYRVVWRREMFERGIEVALGRRDRLVWDEQVWDGFNFRRVVLRRWHDGSISVEREDQR